ncbi:MAG: ribosome biogenesis GTP-binding protein YihA/YsxC [Erysipelotrichaceae bacterium]
MKTFATSKYLITAAKKEQFPATLLPEIVLAGRSNVGKSSLINALANVNALAFVGKRAGKTRYLNFFSIGDVFHLVDVPGYGFANRSKKELSDYARLMEDYFGTRTQCIGAILVVDIRRGLTVDDLDMLEYVRAIGLPTKIVATKSDKFSYSQRLKAKKGIAEQTGDTDTIIFSAESKEGVEAVRQWCLDHIQNHIQASQP